MARQRKELKAKNLRKQKNGKYRDSKTGLEYSKTGYNKYNMVVNKEAQKKHQSNVRKLKRLNKKYNGAFNKELQLENENWNSYKTAINNFNKGKTVRPSTVKKELNYFTTKNKQQAKLISNKKSISSIVSDKHKVQIMRMTGKHGIYNGKAYDDYVAKMSDELDLSIEDTEQLLFPVKDDTEIKYEDIHNFLNGKNKMKTVFDVIDEKEKNGEISEEKSIELQNLAMIGE